MFKSVDAFLWKMKYRFFEHTADAEFRAYGKTLAEAFRNAASAMMSLIVDESGLKGDEVRHITVEGFDDHSLLYNFLEEIVFLIDTEGVIAKEAVSLEIGEGMLVAGISGDMMSKKMQLHGEVKAVTYNRMEIGQEKGTYFVQVVVDL